MMDGFEWINRAITVTGGDYCYEGQLLCSFPKEPGGPIRYIVRDANNRLFIHNAKQCGFCPPEPPPMPGNEPTWLDRLMRVFGL